MTQFHWTFVSVAWFLLFSGAEAQEIGAPDPLFQSDEILDVRIVAPIPGKGTVGVEVPNTQSTFVYLREVLSGKDFQKAC